MSRDLKEHEGDDSWGILELCWQPRLEGRIPVVDVLFVSEDACSNTSEANVDLVADGSDQPDVESETPRTFSRSHPGFILNSPLYTPGPRAHTAAIVSPVCRKQAV